MLSARRPSLPHGARMCWWLQLRVPSRCGDDISTHRPMHMYWHCCHFRPGQVVGQQHSPVVPNRLLPNSKHTQAHTSTHIHALHVPLHAHALASTQTRTVTCSDASASAGGFALVSTPPHTHTAHKLSSTQTRTVTCSDARASAGGFASVSTSAAWKRPPQSKRAPTCTLKPSGAPASSSASARARLMPRLVSSAT
eukprot:355317-Chlamydomonas_euryale.AAC.6